MLSRRIRFRVPPSHGNGSRRHDQTGTKLEPDRSDRPTALAAVLAWLAVKFFDVPTRFIGVAIIGVTNGSIYGIVALGYTLVYGILQLIGFAHGDVFALSGLVASTIIVSVLGLDADTAVLAIIRRAAAHARDHDADVRVRQRLDRAHCLQATPPRSSACAVDHAVGVSFIVQTVGLAFYGSLLVGTELHSRTDAIRIGDIVIEWNKLSVFFIVVPVLVLLTWFVRSTRQGKAMRAVAQDREASAMMGIDVNRTISVTFVIAGSLAAAAGLVYLQFNMRTKTWSYAIGAFFGGVAGAFYASYKAGAFPADFYFNFSIFLLCMVILGGMGSIWGVIVGGLILGYLNIEGLSTIGLKIQNAGSSSFFGTPTQHPVRDLRRDHRPHDALQADGQSSPSVGTRSSLRRACTRTPFYDVQSEGTLTDRDSSDD